MDSRKVLDGERFPLLYVDLRHLMVAPDHEYMVDRGPAKIIFIGQDAINCLAPTQHEKLVRELKRVLHSLYHYDVFVSYNSADAKVAENRERSLKALGMRVFRDPLRQPGQEYYEMDGRALLDSLMRSTLRRTCALHNGEINRSSTQARQT